VAPKDSSEVVATDQPVSIRLKGFFTMYNLGMSKTDIEKYSLINACRATMQHQPLGFEKEISDQVAKEIHQSPRGFFVPNDVLNHRGLSIGLADHSGENLVPTDIKSFIDILANAMLVRKLGATVLSGLSGDVGIPTLTVGTNSYWLDENGEPTEGLPVFAQLGLSPFTVGAYVDVTRQLVLQSSLNIESFLRMDLARSIGLKIDSACIIGGGENEPEGILAAVVANPATADFKCGDPDGDNLDYAGCCEIEAFLSDNNADQGKLGWLTNGRVRGLLRATQKFPSSNSGPVWEEGNTILGWPSYCTNQVPHTLAKGSSGAILSAAIFGNWQELVIGEFGVLDILIDPYSLSKSGGLRITAFQSVDVALRHDESFVRVVDINTTLSA
jgi:HK97 family phage major capsid protein